MLDIMLAPMALEPKTFTAGDTVRVTVTFKYTLGVAATLRFHAGPYYTNIFGKHLVDPCVGLADIPLPVASTPTEDTADVDFNLIPSSLSGIEDGTYGLRVWVENTDAMAEQDSVIVVTGNPASGDMFSSMMPMLMMVMMLGMVMPMTQQMGNGTEEE